ncbi:hypothetical protein JXB31_02245, partial [Candidatus Woesearchaeota archaeon]|nr:hypothetical protein [Candidatus Woesearchaeota archaeon]
QPQFGPIYPCYWSTCDIYCKCKDELGCSGKDCCTKKADKDNIVIECGSVCGESCGSCSDGYACQNNICQYSYEDCPSDIKGNCAVQGFFSLFGSGMSYYECLEKDCPKSAVAEPLQLLSFSFDKDTFKLGEEITAEFKSTGATFYQVYAKYTSETGSTETWAWQDISPEDVSKYCVDGDCKISFGSGQMIGTFEWKLKACSEDDYGYGCTAIMTASYTVN